MKKTIIGFAAAVFLTACNAFDFSETKLPVDVTLPVADFKITDSTIMSWAGVQDYITVSEENVLQVSTSVDMDLGSVNDLQDLFLLGNQTFIFHALLGAVSPIPVEIEIPEGTAFSAAFDMGQGRSANWILLKEGTIGLDVTNTAADFSRASCLIPQLTKNNVALTLRPGEKKNLSGYKLVLSNSEISFDLSGKILVKAGDDLSDVILKLNLSNLSLQEGEGFFGRTEIEAGPYSGTFDSGVTDFFKDCTYYLANPKMSFEINNTFGLPVLAKIKSLKISGKEIKLKEVLGGSKILISPENRTSYVLSNAATQTGQGLSLALSENVSSYEISFSIITNPTAEDVGDKNYVAPDVNRIDVNNKVAAHGELVIPFDCTFSDLPFEQDLDMALDFGDTEASDYDYLKIGVACENELPLDLSFTLYAVSASGEASRLFDGSLEMPGSNARKPGTAGFEPGIIDQTNAQIKTIRGPLVKTFMDADKLKLVFNGKTVRDNDAVGGAVKIYSPSSLKLKLICNLKGEF